MKSIRVHQFGEPEVMKLETLADPKPGPGEVLVRLKAIGVNPVDTYVRAGQYGPKTFPYTPGLDAAGVVEAAGAGLGELAVGARVYVVGSLTGTYAELALCKSSQVHLLPDALTFAQGAAIGTPYITAYCALFDRGQARPKETVMIHGASGGVGVAAVQLARSRGLQVIGTAGTPAGMDLVKQQGAHHALDHTRPDYLDTLMKLTDNRGVDLIIEMLANVNLAKDLTVLARRGRVVVVGSRGKIEIDPRETMRRLADIRGLSVLVLSEEEIAEALRAVDEALHAGALKPVVGREFPLAEAPQAHKTILSPGAHGKIVLVP